jgi:hypothetical protein
MKCLDCFDRGHSPVLRQPENDYSEHSQPDAPSSPASASDLRGAHEPPEFEGRSNV